MQVLPMFLRRRVLVGQTLLSLVLLAWTTGTSAETTHKVADNTAAGADLVTDATGGARGDEQPQAPVEVTRASDPGEHAPTIDGLTGLFRVVSAEIPRTHTFRLGLHAEWFTDRRFLAPTNDRHERFLGTLAASYTPWKHLELSLNVHSQSNENKRDDPERLDQQVVLCKKAREQHPVPMLVTTLVD